MKLLNNIFFNLNLNWKWTELCIKQHGVTLVLCNLLAISWQEINLEGCSPSRGVPTSACVAQGPCPSGVSLPWSESPAGHGVQNRTPFTTTPSQLCFQCFQPPVASSLCPPAWGHHSLPRLRLQLWRLMATDRNRLCLARAVHSPLPVCKMNLKLLTAAKRQGKQGDCDRSDTEWVKSSHLEGVLEEEFIRSWSQYNTCCLRRQKNQ